MLPGYKLAYTVITRSQRHMGVSAGYNEYVIRIYRSG